MTCSLPFGRFFVSPDPRSHRVKRFLLMALAPVLAAGLLLPLGAVPASASASSAPTVVDNTSAGIRYEGAWRSTSSASDHGGSVAFSSTAAKASLTFTGTQVTVLSRLTSSSGIGEVRIDGKPVGTFDGYSRKTQYRQTVFTANLDAGEHTITVVRSGGRNAASSGTNLIIDAFLVKSDGARPAATATQTPLPPATPAPATPKPAATAVGAGTYENSSTSLKYSGKWSRMSSGSDSGGSSEYLNAAGSLSLTFTGSAVRWLSRTTPSAGTAHVYLDGVKVATVDRYSKSTLYKQVVFERTGLTDTEHVIQIVRSGSKNASSSGGNLMVDALVVPDTTSAAQPAGVRAVQTDGAVVVSWQGAADPDVAGYRVYNITSDARYVLVGAAPRDATSFRDLGVAANAHVQYAVVSVDSSGNASPYSMASVNTAATPASTYRFSHCPPATATVSNAQELMLAVANAAPGATIRMAAGTYSGQMNLSARGTADKPVWVCGPRNAVVNVGSIADKHGIIISDSSHVVLTGMTVTNGLKGVTVRKSNNVTVSDVLVESVGYEGIHLRENTTDSVVVGNTIRKTGQRDAFYGEGIYVGTSDANWCNLTACQPDRSDRNAIIGNTIASTGAQLIEVKEGTTGGVVRGNNLSGANAMARAEAWVKVKGNAWSIIENTGDRSSEHGFAVNGSVAGWGLSNLFAHNTATVNASGYGFDVYERQGKGTSQTIVSCSNSVLGAAAGFSNLACAATGG